MKYFSWKSGLLTLLFAIAIAGSGAYFWWRDLARPDARIYVPKDAVALAHLNVARIGAQREILRAHLPAVAKLFDSDRASCPGSLVHAIDKIHVIVRSSNASDPLRGAGWIVTGRFHDGLRPCVARLRRDHDSALTDATLYALSDKTVVRVLSREVALLGDASAIEAMDTARHNYARHWWQRAWDRDKGIAAWVLAPAVAEARTRYDDAAFGLVAQLPDRYRSAHPSLGAVHRVAGGIDVADESLRAGVTVITPDAKAAGQLAKELRAMRALGLARRFIGFTPIGRVLSSTDIDIDGTAVLISASAAPSTVADLFAHGIAENQ